MPENYNLPRPLRGIIPPMVTPLLNDHTLDHNGLERLVEHLIKGGVHGLFILGTTGEGTSLSYALRREMVTLTCKWVSARIPVLVGITDSSPGESLSLAQTAAESGASALVAAPPYYFGMQQSELVDYYLSLAEQMPLPLFLYNMPSHTKIHFEPSTVKALSAHPNIVGLKDSSGNGVYFNSLLYLMRNDPEFTIMVGPEEIMAATVVMGGHGGVNGGANMFPKLYVDLYHAALSRDFDRMLILHNMVMEISHNIYGTGESPSSYLQGLKSALSEMGICNDFIASPLKCFEEKEKLLIRENLSHLSVLNRSDLDNV
jgi:4-hydroxy-tetrahydrodipicolinate synthase